MSAEAAEPREDDDRTISERMHDRARDAAAAARQELDVEDDPNGVHAARAAAHASLAVYERLTLMQLLMENGPDLFQRLDKHEKRDRRVLSFDRRLTDVSQRMERRFDLWDQQAEDWAQRIEQRLQARQGVRAARRQHRGES